MAAGLQFRNGGQIQVDENFRNMALRHKGAIGAWPRVEALDYRIYTIRLPVERPIMAVPLTGLQVRVWSMLDHLDGTWSISILTVGDPGGLNFYLYDVAQNIPDSAGIMVWNGAGSVVFNSSQKYMQIMAVNGLPTVPAGRTYAYVQAGQRIQKSDIAIDGSGGFNRTTRLNVYNRQADDLFQTLYTTNVEFYDGAPVYRPPVFFGQENFLILDITYQ